jgi:nitrogen-specific signal transduction histidine kinase/FixJ family two-component response regulator
VITAHQALCGCENHKRRWTTKDIAVIARDKSLLDRAHRLESLGELTGGIAHDFNNLLCIITSYAEFVAEAVEPEVVKARAADPVYWNGVRDDISNIQRAVDRGAELARRLLSFAGRIVIQPEPLDIETVVDEVAALLRRSLGEHIELVTDIPVGTWPILVDPGEFSQVLLNMAVNARYAMEGGGTLTIRAANIPKGPSRGESVRVQVSDTGAGMSPETRMRALEPFFTTKPPGEGTGLGLASALEIIQGAGGTIDIESELGQGSTILIDLPRSHYLAAPMPVAAVDGPGPIASGQVILLVEDNDAVRTAVSRMLSRNGYVVLSASNGSQALELLRSGAHDAIDLLVTDVVMPRMLGRELATCVRAERPGIRVLFMSGYAVSSPGLDNTLEPGSILLNKPFGEGDLLAKVSAVLGGVRHSVAEPSESQSLLSRSGDLVTDGGGFLKEQNHTDAGG